jgi:hypothetical protein
VGVPSNIVTNVCFSGGHGDVVGVGGAAHGKQKPPPSMKSRIFITTLFLVHGAIRSHVFRH